MAFLYVWQWLFSWGCRFRRRSNRWIRPFACGRDGTLTDAYHEGPYPGYIYHIPGGVDADRGDRYDPKVYNQGGTDYESGQIFPVLPGNLSVWWSNATTHGLLAKNVYSVYWPSKVMDYGTKWPHEMSGAEVDGTLVLASEQSSPILAPEQTPEVYFQNKKSEIGYCPNCEAELMRWGARFGHNIDGVMEVVKLAT